MPLSPESAIDHLLDLLRVPGLSGEERQIADAIKTKLRSFGCKDEWMMEDDAHTRIPGNFEMGNLIIKIPGTAEGPRLMFSGHMDTVPLTRGAVPKREESRIVAEGATALGADNRTACAAMLSLAEVLLRDKPGHPPITLLFTVGEEIGLWGAREVNPADLGHPEQGFNIDSGNPEEVVIGAIGAHRWTIDVKGICSHAGVHPDHGVSATLIASKAIAAMEANGYFGAINLNGRLGTSNIGVFEGGEATNQVTDQVYIKGESRSHDPEFLEEITSTIQQCFEEAAASVTNHLGNAGSIDFHCDRDYDAFMIPDGSPVVTRTLSAISDIGLNGYTARTDGGLDANYLNTKGIPTVTLGAGQHHPHTVDEYCDIDEFLNGCRLLLQIATHA